MLLEQLLNERLGTLSQLKVGPMINILRQSKYQGRQNRANPAGKNFGEYSDIGHDSEVVDVGSIKKKGFADLRKALKNHENDGKAFAIYVDGKAVMFGVSDYETLRGQTRQSLVAFDFTSLEDEIKADVAKQNEEESQKERWRQREVRMPELTSYVEEEPSSWDLRDNPNAPKRKFPGQRIATSDLKGLVEKIIRWAGDKDVTAKIVLTDSTKFDKRRERSARLQNSDVLTGLESLKRRLAQFKISKKPSAASIEEFLEKAFSQTASVIQFAGFGYRTTPEESYDSVKPINILQGKPFKVRYRAVDPGAYSREVELTYAFDRQAGTLAPYKATWIDRDGEHHIAALQKEPFIKQEFGVRTVDKDTIIKKILQKVKDGNTHEAKSLLKKARAAGYNYPEFDTIERSIAADEAAKKKQQEAA